MREKIDAKSKVQGMQKPLGYPLISQKLDYTDYKYYENITVVVSIGFPESRLPSFTKEDSAEIMDSFDFLGINFYTADIVYTKESDPNVVSYYADQDVSSYKVDTYNC